jgi:hypothetical protein
LLETVEHKDLMAKPDRRGGQARPRYDACAVNKYVVQLHSCLCGRARRNVASRLTAKRTWGAIRRKYRGLQGSKYTWKAFDAKTGGSEA